MQKISYHLYEREYQQVLSGWEHAHRGVRSTIPLRTPMNGGGSGVRAMDQEHNRAPALAADTEEERQEAMRRVAVLRPHLHDGVPVPEAARDSGVPLRSVPRWLARYRATGWLVWSEPHDPIPA